MLYIKCKDTWFLSPFVCSLIIFSYPYLCPYVFHSTAASANHPRQWARRSWWDYGRMWSWPLQGISWLFAREFFISLILFASIILLFYFYCAITKHSHIYAWSYQHLFPTVRGELTSKATRWQRLLLKQEYNIDTGSATYGRKLDLQCRVDKHELNNSEFKVDAISSQQTDIQYRKNLRVNQAMMLYLKEEIGMPLENLEVLALDVQGKGILELPFLLLSTT